MKTLLLTLVFLSSGVGHAADQDKKVTEQKLYDYPPVKIQKIEGFPVVVSWPDRREAVEEVVYGKPGVFPTDFEVTENSCMPKVAVSCSLNLTFRVHSLKLVWTLNPDPTKVGQTVIRKFDQSTVPIFSDYVSGQTDQKIAPVIAEGVEPISITCKDYSWLPGGTYSEAPSSLNIVHWNNEFMVLNNETDVSENHALSSLLDVTMARGPEGGLVMQGYRHVVSSNPLFPASVGETTSLFIRSTPSGDLCQITLKPKLAAVRAEIGRQSYLNHQQTFAPYIYGSDELFLRDKQVRFYLDLLNETVPEKQGGTTVTRYREGMVE